MGNIYVNPKQEKFLEAPQKIKTFQIGRGGGKTTVEGDEKFEDVRILPKCRSFLLCKTFKQGYDNFVPEILDRLRKYGFKEHISSKDPGHYVVCKKPPEWWDLPFRKVQSYENVISFFNGHTFHILSFDRPDLARGGSYQVGTLDEALLFDYNVLIKTVLPLLRGNKNKIKSPRAGSLRIYSSMPWLQKGKWVVNTMRRLAAEQPKKYFFLQGSARDNIEVLGEDYFDTMKGMMDPITYAVEIDNQEINKLPNSFYAYLGEQHLYSPDYDYEYSDQEEWKIKPKDIDPELPIEPSFDFNAEFTSCSIWQDFGSELRASRIYWIKYDLIEVLVDNVCTAFSNHKNKTAYIYGGKDGHSRRSLTSIYTLFQLIVNRFEFNGWLAFVMVDTSQVDGEFQLRHTIVNNVLRGDDPSLPQITINEEHAKLLYQSMSQAPVKDDFKKNKSSEKDKDLAQEYATHLSDTFDNYIIPKCSNKVTRSADGLLLAGRV